MKYRRTQNTIWIRIDKGEPVIETVLKVCEKENVRAGYFQGIGACEEAVLSTWIAKKQDFIYHTLTGTLEMISLMGNITIGNDGHPYSHSHATFSYLNEKGEVSVTAGHVKEARIGYTGEIIVNTAENFEIGRMVDPAIGIEVWEL